jgi:hypothetical protein
LVSNLISVAAEPAPAPDLVLLQPGQRIYKNALAANARGWVSVFQPPTPEHMQVSVMALQHVISEGTRDWETTKDPRLSAPSKLETASRQML